MAGSGEMGFEVEFHPVGDKSRAGDAITIRYGHHPDYKIIIVDGGTDDSGDALVDHVRTFYGASAIVSDVICTHPDTDHACGLRGVLKELPVQRLWLHGVWHHSGANAHLFSDKRWTPAGLTARIKSNYPVIAELLALAADKVPVHEPFAGTQIGPLTVLSPTEWHYERLVPQFRKTPDPDVEALTADGMWLGSKKTLLERLIAEALGVIEETAARVASNWIRESWAEERLRDGGITAAENESSLVMLGDFTAYGGGRILLTGDAGNRALNWACDYADLWGIDRGRLDLIQVPHHGSRRNVGPTTLNRLVGPILPEGSRPLFTAAVSSPKDDTTHPRDIVLNAFIRRGGDIALTQGKRFRFHNNMPARLDEAPLQTMAIKPVVEAYDD